MSKRPDGWPLLPQQPGQHATPSRNVLVRVTPVPPLPDADRQQSLGNVYARLVQLAAQAEQATIDHSYDNAA